MSRSRNQVSIPNSRGRKAAVSNPKKLSRKRVRHADIDTPIQELKMLGRSTQLDKDMNPANPHWNEN